MYEYLESRNKNVRFAKVKSVEFSLLSNDTIKRISSADITSSDSKKDYVKKTTMIEHNSSPGLLGSTDQTLCDRCRFNKSGCTGHSGNCTLRYPMVHPFHTTYAKSLLKSYCLNCSRKFKPEDKLTCGGCNGFRYQSVRLNNVPLDKVLVREDVRLYNNIDECIRNDLFWLVMHKNTAKNQDTQHVRLLIPEEITKFIENIKDINVDGCIIRELYIPSNNTRPSLNKTSAIPIGDNSTNRLSATMSESSKKFIDPITALISQIQRHNSMIKYGDQMLFNNFPAIKAIHLLLFHMLVEGSSEIIPVKSSHELADIGDIKRIPSGLTVLSKCIADNNNYNNVTINVPPSLKSQHEKIRYKYGMIRKNILGKRIHNMCRSVIVCDPTLPNDTIRIPIIYAQRLDTTEVVTEYNIDRLNVLFQNGINSQYPKITKYTKILSKGNSNSYHVTAGTKNDLKIGDIVSRDMIDGDVVLFNRQPSLLYSNITAFRIVVDPDPECCVVSFNVTIAHFFNADFDGDQMSVIHLNDFSSKFEALQLCSANNFCISKQTSLANLGQTYDSIIGAFLSSRDTSMVSYYDSLYIMSKTSIPKYKELVDELFKDSKTKLINCRELHSLAIPKNINLNIKPSWYNSDYESAYSDTEKRLIIKNGKIIQGTLDKNSVAIGSKDSYYRQIQYDVDSPTMLDAVFNTQQIAIGYTLNKGFTLGIKDVVVPNNAIAEERSAILNKTLDNLCEYILMLQERKINPPVGYNLKDYYNEMYMNQAEMKIPDIAGKINFDENNLFQLIQSGSKGKMSVMSQMTSAVGMIKIDGQMPPETYSVGRFLPYYMRYEMTPESYAFVKNSYYSGLSGPEFLPATMQSRLEIITKALMTAVSGEQNRNSIKALESNVTTSSRSVVNSQNTVQALYGGDGFDIASLIIVNMNSIYNKEVFDAKVPAASTEEYDTLVQFHKTLRTLAIRYQKFQYIFHDMSDVYKFYIPVDVQITLNKHINKVEGTIIPITAKKTFDIVNKFCNNELPKALNFCKNPDLVKQALFKTECAIRTFLSVQYHKEPFISEKILDALLNDLFNKVQQAIITEANAIGIITAQCISEPITQKTLDTHHGAAQEGSKKTGMGRIKELIGSKDNATQNMMMCLKGKARYDKETTELISKSMETIFLSDFVKDIEIHYTNDLDKLHSYNNFKINYNKPTINGFHVVVFVEINRTVLLSKKNIEYKNIINMVTNKYKHVYNTALNSDKLIIMIAIPINKDIKTSTQTEIVNTINNITNDIRSLKIQGITGINKTNVIKITKTSYSKEPMYIIVTNGVNIIDICEKYHELIDLSTIQIDDMKLYNQYFGISATKEKLLYELRETIDSSISIKNYKLVADNICILGFLTSFEKAGIDKREGSHVLLRLGKSHFRQVLEDASHNNRTAAVSGLTASLLVGQVPSDFGTAAVDIEIDPYGI